MRFPWPSHKTDYESSAWRPCSTRAGVEYRIRRISLARRIELAGRLRDLASELEFRQAGNSAADQVEAASIAARIELEYVRWGLIGVRGLTVDGDEASADVLFERGPEGVFQEIAKVIKNECALTADEIKN